MHYDYKIKSPCKINLCLYVHNKREDGYHDLTSIFQLIDLWDEIKLKINNTGKIDVVGDFDCSLEDNLIYKAAKLFCERANIADGMVFEVVKNIPAGGGLGGGSGNGASVLKLLSYIYKDRLSVKEIYEIGSSLGSDIPFFLKSPTSMVQGRGEHVDSIETVEGYYILTVNPRIHISTKEAFSELYKNGGIEPKNSALANNLISLYKKGVKYFHNYKNSFEIAMQSDYTFIQDIKTILKECNCDYASLTGSGSTMFGIFTNYDEALRAKKVLSQKNYIIKLVKPLSYFPEVERRLV